jgi:hypothetical protein
VSEEVDILDDIEREPWSCPYCGTPYGAGNEIRDDCCAGAELSALKMEHVTLQAQLRGAVSEIERAHEVLTREGAPTHSDDGKPLGLALRIAVLSDAGGR